MFKLALILVLMLSRERSRQDKPSGVSCVDKLLLGQNFCPAVLNYRLLKMSVGNNSGVIKSFHHNSAPRPFHAPGTVTPTRGKTKVGRGYIRRHGGSICGISKGALVTNFGQDSQGC